MKILFALNSFFPDSHAGTEVYVLGLARYLREQGHTVNIIAPSSKPRSYEYEGIHVYQYKVLTYSSSEELNGLRPPCVLDEFKSILGLLKPDIVHFHSYNRAMNSWHIKLAKEKGINVVFTTHVAGLFCIRSDLCYKGNFVCDGKIRLHRCMACYIHQRVGCPVLSELLAVGVNISNLLLPWLKNFKPFLYSVRKKKKDLALIYRYTDKIISISKWMVETYRINGIENVIPIVYEIVKGGFQSSETIADDVDIVPPSLNQKKDKIKLIFVGRLYPIKNIELLLEALSLEDYSRFNLTMVVIPDKDSKSYYDKIRTKYNSMGFKDWHENLSAEEVKQLISSSDMLCLPSRSEVAPLVIHEAFNCGVPVLGSDIPPISELVTHGKNGLLFRSNSLDSLIRTLNVIMADSSLISILRNNVYQMSDINLVYKRIEEVYKEMVIDDKTI